MAIVSMDTNNPLGQRPFQAMSGLDGTWDLREQHRSWIVRDTESAPIERMRIPPELLGMQVPVAAELYRPGPGPSLLGMAISNGIGINRGVLTLPDWVTHKIPNFSRPANPRSPEVVSLLTPGGTTPPVIPTVAPQENSFAQIIPTGSALVAISPGASTQNLVPSDTTVARAAPSLTSIVAGGQPATSAVSTVESWFSDPAQELIGGVPNWTLVAALAVLAMMQSKGRR